MARTRHVLFLVTILATIGPWAGRAMAQGDQPAQPENPVAVEPTVGQAANLPSAESLFERYVQEAGGLEAMRKLKNRKQEGIMTTQPVRTKSFFTVWFVNPNKLFARIERPGEPITEIVYDGQIGWRRFGNDYIPITGDDLVRLKEGADFLGEANYKQRYTSLKTVQKIPDFGGTPVYAVRVKSVNDKAYMVFFDADTGILRGVETTVGEGNRRRLLQAEVRDFKRVGGVLYPMTTIRRTLVTKDQITEERVAFDTIEVNVDDVPSFERPASLVETNENAPGESGGG